ncbi:MAG: type I glutamate--ammonia ligase [Gammaproteobacteria bacterium RIFCSPHIGHO2_12_FULL_35_23]|nr:MAG: type I glutamate--ammonia ligase [Gammaproteobacteria bacterium RIFCSPHIGHO2_12_FULL_35_23]
MANNIMKMIADEKIKYIDLRFIDTIGKEQHVTIPAFLADKNFFEEGKMFDGSSIKGWQKINCSDMILMPDQETAVLDPFYKEATLILRCNIVDPSNMLPYERDPRSLAARAEAYLKSTGIADTANFGPEPEFFLFNDMRHEVSIRGAFYSIDSDEGAWNSGRTYDGGNLGHRPRVKGGYFPVPPVDSSQDIRSCMCEVLTSMGLKIEAHHHEVATGNQNEIATRFNSLLKKADELLTLKYVVHNVAHQFGYTATFMPKPLVGDNGNGMHCHQSLSKDGKNIFTGDQYAGLSENALYYIGGILKHARALNAFTNPGTNSYRRLVPGFEAPVMLAYSARNRSASIRIPYVSDPRARRIEVRFPDPTANPYFAFSAMMMAGIDGIKNKILPGDPMDKDLYDLPPEETKNIPTVCSSLGQALDALIADHEFLTVGGVFSEDMLEAYIELKREEIQQVGLVPHPVEFDLYYSL